MPNRLAMRLAMGAVLLCAGLLAARFWRRSAPEVLPAPPRADSLPTPRRVGSPPANLPTPSRHVAPQPASPAQAPTNAPLHAPLRAVRIQARAFVAEGPEALDRLPERLHASAPEELAAALAAWAVLAADDLPIDWAALPPEALFAALDAAADLGGDAAAARLLDGWRAVVGHEAITAHAAAVLATPGGLPSGGAHAALSLVTGMADAETLAALLRSVAAEPTHAAATRLQALLLLRTRLDFETYQGLVRQTDRAAQAADDASWAASTARLRERVDGPAELMNAPLLLDRSFAEAALARPYPALLTDLHLYLQTRAEAGELRLTPDGATVLTAGLAQAAQTPLDDGERAAAAALSRLLAHLTAASAESARH